MDEIAEGKLEAAEEKQKKKKTKAHHIHFGNTRKRATGPEDVTEK